MKLNFTPDRPPRTRATDLVQPEQREHHAGEIQTYLQPYLPKMKERLLNTPIQKRNFTNAAKLYADLRILFPQEPMPLPTASLQKLDTCMQEYIQERTSPAENRAFADMDHTLKSMMQYSIIYPEKKQEMLKEPTIRVFCDQAFQMLTEQCKGLVDGSANRHMSIDVAYYLTVLFPERRHEIPLPQYFEQIGAAIATAAFISHDIEYLIAMYPEEKQRFRRREQEILDTQASMNAGIEKDVMPLVASAGEKLGFLTADRVEFTASGPELIFEDALSTPPALPTRSVV